MEKKSLDGFLTGKEVIKKIKMKLVLAGLKININEDSFCSN